MPALDARQCQQCKAEFLIEPDDFNFYEKAGVPPPTFCPQCRLVRRLSWRNERSLHKRTCALCGQVTLAMYSERSPIQVYCNQCWWSDQWDALHYGADFDPSRPFLEQVFSLMRRVPAVSRFGLYPTLINSEYTNMVGSLKNCYLVTHSDYNEDCSYASNLTNSKHCIDAYLADKCEGCYEIANCRDCYRTMFSVDCNSCHNVLFSKDCQGCSDCFGCSNLRNKRYHIFNQPFSKEEYERRMQDLYPTTFARVTEARARAEEVWARYPRKYAHERLNANMTGDYIYNCKNVHDSFIAAKLEDSRFCMLITPGESAASSNLWDFTHFGVNSQIVYESLMGGWCSRVRFSWFMTAGAQDCDYSMWCVDAKDLFGCVGVKKKQYCILNKQYSKEDYLALREKIIAHMNEMPYIDKQGRTYRYGEFFPAEASPFGYNETAHAYFPLSKDEALARGYPWLDAPEKSYAVTKTEGQLPEGPDFAGLTKDDIIACAHRGRCDHNCSTAFRFIPSEIDFYKQYRLPLPRLCPNCRHMERVAQTNPPRLWLRSCACEGDHGKAYANTAQHFHGIESCPNQFQTSYAPDRAEIVYCEQCYNAEVV